MLLGDARTGKLGDNLVAFGRSLRRAGVPVDAARIALAHDALLAVGLDRRDDVSAALEAVLVGREQDRAVFRELFDAFFRDPEVAHKLLSQMLPSAEGRADPIKRRPRVREALQPRQAYGQTPPEKKDTELHFDATMTASDSQRLRHADFNQLSAGEYRLVESLVRDIHLPLPEHPARRTRAGLRGALLHWPRVVREAARGDGMPTRLWRREREREPLPLLILVDVSGSMERYSRMLLAFLHAATRDTRRRDVFAFGTTLTDLSDTFRLADTDAMLLTAGARIPDFAGGTRLGDCLGALRRDHARRLVGRRTLVLVISDGLDTGERDALVGELQWLRRHCGSLLWLNPLMRYDSYAPLARGASALHAACDRMVAVHNLTRLEELAQSLTRLLRERRTGRR